MSGKNEFWLVRNATHHYTRSHIIQEEGGKILAVDGGDVCIEC